MRGNCGCRDDTANDDDKQSPLHCVPILAAVPVIEPIAIADVEACLAAILPDRELHRLEVAVERASIDPLCHEANTSAQPPGR